MKPMALVFRGATVLAVGALLAACATSAERKADRPKAKRPQATTSKAAQGTPLGVRLFSYGKYEEAAWTQLPKLGIKYVFMAVPAADQVEAVQKKLASSGLKVAVMRGDAQLTGPEALVQLESQFKVCQELGVRYVFLSAKHPGVEKEVAYDLLRKLGQIAKKYQVTVCLETHPDLGTNADEHLATMKAVNHPNIRVNFDTGNITYYNKDRDAVSELRKVIDYVATVEIKDHNGQYMTWNFPPHGKGVVDIPGVLKVLKEHGYRGPITLEIEGVEGVQRSEQQIKDEIAESVKHVRSLRRSKSK